MSDRLTELQRQRALIQGHLAWLDKEIAASTNGPAPTSPPSPVVLQPAAPSRPENPIAANQATDDVSVTFGTDTKSAALSARKGCLVVFYVALVLVLLLFFGLYRYSLSRYPKNEPVPVNIAPEAPAKR